MNNLPSLEPSGIGESVRNNLMPWFIKLRFTEPSEILDREWFEAFTPLSPLQAKTGDKFEKKVYSDIKPKAKEVHDSWFEYENHGKNEEKLIKIIEGVKNQSEDESPTILLQARFSGNIHDFHIAGDADLIILWPTEESVRIRVIDIKSSWDEKPYQQIQTATYTVLLRQVLEKYNVKAEVEGGIIFRESNWLPLEPETLPIFDLTPREDDVKRLLESNGPFEYALTTDIEELQLSAGSASKGSYSEIYNVISAEREELSILGITRGEQEILQQNGIKTIGELASLYEPLENPKPYKFEDPEMNDDFERKIKTIEESHALSTRLPILCQKAQSILGTINPEHDYAHDKPWPSWIQGVGPANIPDENPPDSIDNGMSKNSLIRIYLNIQEDYVRDRVIMASAHIDCTRNSGTPETISEYSESIPTQKEESLKREQELLDSFSERLFEAVKHVRNKSKLPGKAPVHFYTYTENELDLIEEATERHKEKSKQIKSLHSLLTMRRGIDQMMVSPLQPEVENKIALKSPTTGLIPAIEQLQPKENEDALDKNDWIFSDDNNKHNLKDVFSFGLTNSQRAFKRSSEKISFENVNDADGFMHVLPRFDAQIPLEYIWSSLDEFGPEWVEDKTKKQYIEKYRWCDDSKDNRISPEMVAKVSEIMAKGVKHVERSLTYRDASIEKEPISIDTIDSFSRPESTLSDSCREYLDLEYKAQRDEALTTYKQPIKQRVLSGESVPLRISDVEDNGYMIRVQGELIYDELSFENPKQVAQSSRVSGSSGSSSGSWLVATPMDKRNGSWEADTYSPENIEHSTPVSINEFNPRDGSIEFESYRVSRSQDDSYQTWYYNWTTDPSERDSSSFYFAPGEEFVLDPSASMSNGEKALTALENAEENDTYQTITKLRKGTKKSTDYTRFESNDFNSYLNWVENNWEPTPNDKQEKFIKQCDDKFVLLQGPPGTGKTSGALSHALVSRLVAASEDDYSLTGLVSGSSNKSVNEVMEDVADIVRECSNGNDKILSNVRLVRLSMSTPPADEAIDGVDYVEYNTDDLDPLRKRISPGNSRQTELNEAGESNPPQTIIFGTPGRVYKFFDKMHEGLDIEMLYNASPDVFDIFAVDEASMMPLHDLLTCTSFVSSSGQHLIAGDQRQMPPVQQYDWNNESRPSIVNQLPHLSTLDYFRFLRGDEIDIDTEDVKPPQPDADIPLVQLEKTYRCHKLLAEFLREWVYSQDELNYTSDEEETIEDIIEITPGLNCTSNPESPVTLVVHDDTTSTQVNFAEATLVKSITQSIPDSEDIGVVTPHNAQKGLISTMCSGDTTVDTVERFQGGERDAVILSSTVSDPEYLERESEFIMSPNRVNVAMSRMKKKLIVIVPLSLFRHIPSKTEEYNDSRIWKGLYQEFSVANSEPDWSGELDELVGQESVPLEKTKFEIYNGL